MNAMYNLLGKNRFWILLFFLLLLVSSCIAYYFSQVRQEQCVAYIYQDGALIDAVDLAKVKEEQQILITAKNGGSNIVCIAPGKICVQEATCPDHVCVQQGWIDDGIYPIVCLPNKLIIRIENENGDTTVPDVMTQ